MKNKAFTLVELLGVIVLLGILSVVIIPKVGDSLENSKETALLTQEEQIKKAAYDFLIDHTELLDESNTITLKLGILKQGGYLPIKLVNPKTRKPLSNESTITITKIENKYEMTLNLIDLENATENIDNNSPILVLNGNYIEYVEVNEEYTELGAKAIDSTGEEIDEENISIQVLYNGEETTLTTTELKTYSVVYAVTDNSGNTTSATRTVIVRDSTAPTIIIPKDTSLHVSEIASFNNQRGVIIADNYDANPTLTIDSTLANIPGAYVITYTVTDSSGNTTTERRVINVNNDIYESHEIAYQINGLTTPSTTSTPTMDNPVTYYGLGQNGTINVTTTTGKNLFNEESILMAIEGSEYVDGYYEFNPSIAHQLYGRNNNWNYVGSRIIPIHVKKNTQYTISIKGYTDYIETANVYQTLFIAILYTDNTHSQISLSGQEKTVTLTTTQDKTIDKIAISYGRPTNTNDVHLDYIQIEEGTTSTPYEPYKGRTTTIDMTGHDPLMCLGDNCDYIDYENKRIVRNVGKYIVTGNEAWTYRNTTQDGGSTYSITSSDWIMENMNYKYYSGTKSLNNYVKYDGTTTGAADNYYSSKHFTLYYNTTQPNSRTIYINSPTISTQADFKSNLQSLYNNGNPMIIYYELAEPTYESITLPQLSKYYDDYSIIAHDEYGGVEVTY